MTREERTESLKAAFVALLVSAPLIAGCIGCGKPAPAADPPIKYVLPVKECGNPNCVCEDCDGNCECGNRPGPSKAEIEEMKQRLADREQLLEAMKASLASLKKEAEKKSVVKEIRYTAGGYHFRKMGGVTEVWTPVCIDFDGDGTYDSCAPPAWHDWESLTPNRKQIITDAARQREAQRIGQAVRQGCADCTQSVPRGRMGWRRW